MRKRLGLMLAAMSVALVAATAVPAGAHQVDLAKVEIDFGTCRQVVATKYVRPAAVGDYVPDHIALATRTDGAVALTIQATRCRWLRAAWADHAGGTKYPVIVQVGVAIDDAKLPTAPYAPEDNTYALFTVTNSRALARAARAAGYARVYLTDGVRFNLGVAENCGDEVRTRVVVRDDRVPSFGMYGTVRAPGPGCEPEAVPASAWWTVRNGVASAFVVREHRQSVVVADTQLKVWAAWNTRIPRIVGERSFMTDRVTTGLTKVNDQSPDAVIVPFRLLGA